MNMKTTPKKLFEKTKKKHHSFISSFVLWIIILTALFSSSPRLDKVPPEARYRVLVLVQLARSLVHLPRYVRSTATASRSCCATRPCNGHWVSISQLLPGSLVPGSSTSLSFGLALLANLAVSSISLPSHLVLVSFSPPPSERRGIHTLTPSRIPGRSRYRNPIILWTAPFVLSPFSS
ncbi:hypothetical protein BGZ63DRAFT_32245 [Mariannaea sp. PMI_226]|nr:hypothetical protein BGZ63DRAFT_32245 [Mariannaea sp. PMI_226]